MQPLGHVHAQNTLKFAEFVRGQDVVGFNLNVFGEQIGWVNTFWSDLHALIHP